MTDHVANLLGLSEERRMEMNSELLKYKEGLDALDIPTNAKVIITKTILGIVTDCVNSECRLILIRGLPGSGKSTYAKQIQQVFKIVRGVSISIQEADMYMGSRFNPERLQSCHESCQTSTSKFISEGGYVIVSNTSTTREEMAPYIKIALKNKIKMKIIEPPTPWKYNINVCREKCTKPGIPQSVYERYLENLKSM